MATCSLPIVHLIHKYIYVCECVLVYGCAAAYAYIYVKFCTITTLACDKGNSPTSREFFARSFSTLFFSRSRHFYVYRYLRHVWKWQFFSSRFFSASLNSFFIYFLFFLTFRLWCRTASSIMIWLTLKRNILFSFHILMILMMSMYREKVSSR